MCFAFPVSWAAPTALLCVTLSLAPAAPAGGSQPAPRVGDQRSLPCERCSPPGPLCAWSADGALLIVASGRRVRVYDSRLGFAAVRDLHVHFLVRHVACGIVAAAEWEARLGDHLIALAGASGLLVIPHWSAPALLDAPAPEPARERELELPRGAFVIQPAYYIACVEFSASGRLMALATVEGHVGVWEQGVMAREARPAQWACRQQRPGRATSLRFSPGERMLAAGLWGGGVLLYERTASTAAPAAAGSAAAAVESGGAAVTWQLRGDRSVAPQPVTGTAGIRSGCYMVAVSDGGEILYSAGLRPALSLLPARAPSSSGRAGQDACEVLQLRPAADGTAAADGTVAAAAAAAGGSTPAPGSAALAAWAQGDVCSGAAECAAPLQVRGAAALHVGGEGEGAADSVLVCLSDGRLLLSPAAPLA